MHRIKVYNSKIDGRFSESGMNDHIVCCPIVQLCIALHNLILALSQLMNPHPTQAQYKASICILITVQYMCICVHDLSQLMINVPHLTQVQYKSFYMHS